MEGSTSKEVFLRDGSHVFAMTKLPEAQDKAEWRQQRRGKDTMWPHTGYKQVPQVAYLDEGMSLWQ